MTSYKEMHEKKVMAARAKREYRSEIEKEVLRNKRTCKVEWRSYKDVEYLNDWFSGCERHHVAFNKVIHIPAELHKHIPHDLQTGTNMCAVNMCALQFASGYTRAKENVRTIAR